MSRFHFIKQQDAMQCGIACLAMVCRYYGKNYPLDILTKICNATNEGASLPDISEIAEQLGMHTVIGYSSIAQLSKITLPCILLWNQNHFVVLYKIGWNRYYIADPNEGLIKYNESGIKQHWISVSCDDEEKGVVMFLKPSNTVLENVNEVIDSQSKLKMYINRFLELLSDINRYI